MKRLIAHAAALAVAVMLAAPMAAAEDAPGSATGQAEAPPVFLLADRVLVDERGRLVAEGNVEALYRDITFRAQRIVYDRAGNRLLIDGPLRIEDATGRVLTGATARLDPAFRQGLIEGARMVLDAQLQLAAARVDRVNGRYTQLSNAVATSCQVCGPDDVPFWQIRARRAIHDERERQLYFEGAQLRILDVPVLYLPRLRLPDPTLKRARGFLVPSAVSSTLLGTGVRLPYFIPFGAHADLTVAPFVTTNSRSLEMRYRQAFRRGRIEFNGAISSDEIERGEMRGYLFGDGRFELPRDIDLAFRLEATTDRSYLTDYGYSDDDRLNSFVAATRIRPTSFALARLDGFRTLRDGESNATIPTTVLELRHERLVTLPGGAGKLALAAELHSHYRPSDDDVAGRDVTRAGASLSWRKGWSLPLGLRAAARAEIAAHGFWTAQDSGVPETVTLVRPAAAIELRWPLVAADGRRLRQMLEPLVQLGWAGGESPATANDESTRVEFDEGNLISLSRFPAPDRVEAGARLALGLRWLIERPGHWTADLVAGQVFREDAIAAFSRSSGLSGRQSDLMLAGRIATPGGLSLMARALLDADSGVNKAEGRATWSRPRFDLSAAYLLLVDDPAENRPGTISEWSFDGAWRVARHWTASVGARYDLAQDELARARAGLTWRTECVEVDFSAERRFTSTTTVRPSTDYGLTIRLKGFSTGGNAKDYRQTCK